MYCVNNRKRPLDPPPNIGDADNTQPTARADGSHQADARDERFTALHHLADCAVGQARDSDQFVTRTEVSAARPHLSKRLRPSPTAALTVPQRDAGVQARSVVCAPEVRQHLDALRSEVSHLEKENHRLQAQLQAHRSTAAQLVQDHKLAQNVQARHIQLLESNLEDTDEACNTLRLQVQRLESERQGIYESIKSLLPSWSKRETENSVLRSEVVLLREQTSLVVSWCLNLKRENEQLSGEVGRLRLTQQDPAAQHQLIAKNQALAATNERLKNEVIRQREELKMQRQNSSGNELNVVRAWVERNLQIRAAAGENKRGSEPEELFSASCTSPESQRSKPHRGSKPQAE